MAHPCDYQSQRDISRLNKSPSTMNPTPITLSGKKSLPIVDKESYAYILTSNFIRENPTWAIDSAYKYCMEYYKDYGVTKEIFAQALHSYILSKD